LRTKRKIGCKFTIKRREFDKMRVKFAAVLFAKITSLPSFDIGSTFYKFHRHTANLAKSKL